MQSGGGGGGGSTMENPSGLQYAIWFLQWLFLPYSVRDPREFYFIHLFESLFERRESVMHVKRVKFWLFEIRAPASFIKSVCNLKR
jgi:hypothetical protein